MGDQAKNTVKRSASGKFLAGSSGNPSGRPAGRRSAKTVLLAQLVDQQGGAVVAKLMQAARKGSPWAVKLVIERLLPRLERRLNLADLGAVETAEDVAGAVGRVISMAAAGELTVEEARSFLSLLELQRKAIETADLAVRLEILEEDSKGKH